MAESRTIETLRNKREQIEGAIASYERKITQARSDLAHVAAVIAIYEGATENGGHKVYVDILRLFQRGEPMAICMAALKAEGPLSTPTLALRVMAAKRIDVADRVMAKSICLRLVQTLRRQERRGTFVNTGKVKGVCVWALPASGA